MTLTRVGLVTDSTNLDNPIDVATDGTYAYVVKSGRMTVVDVSTPTAPAVVGSVASVDIALTSTLVVAGDYVYVASNDVFNLIGVLVIDVSTPSSPSIVGSLPLANSVSYSSTYDTSPLGLLIDGSLLYVVGYQFTDSGKGKFQVVDVSTPSAPTVTGTLTSTSFPNNGPRRIAKVGSHVWFAADFSVSLVAGVDVSTPSSPTLTATLTLGRTPRGVATDGTSLFVSNWLLTTGGVYVVDVSTPASPTLVGDVTDSAMSHTADLVYAAVNQTVYVVNPVNNTVLPVDVSVPTAPVYVSADFYNGSADSQAVTNGIALAVPHLYVLSQSQDRLIVLDGVVGIGGWQVGSIAIL